ncbi:MAG TPA: VWA domain-containing protein [Anaerolineaceae bacterium]|nr:VWA domain-containing protein [Anaerolineaceae bacterium]
MKPKHLLSLSSLLVIGSLLLSACGALSAIPGVGKKVTVTMLYGSEKQEWLDPLIQQYNQENHKTASGAEVTVEGKALGSIEAVNEIIAGQSQAVVWSPASSLYIPVANAEWRKSHSDDLVSGTPKDLVLSPVVIAMWQPMAEALGWPKQPLGWEDVAKLSTSSEGWAKYNYPEWGAFKFGHTHPDYSNSGLVAIVAQAYAALGKQRGLTAGDLQDPRLRSFLSDVQSSIIHYGTSTGFFGQRMFERGPSYLSAAVMYENLVVAQQSKQLSGQSQQLPVVAIYPKEGTFWANHPYIVLNAPWVTADQREAAQAFETFLLDKPQQTKAIELGFRPSDPSIALTAPLDAQHGVDPAQPKTILEIPKADVISGIQTMWEQTKKPVDVVITIDTSESMAGDKIASARSSLVQFINLLSDRDRLQVVTFSSEVHVLTEMTSLGEKRADLVRRVSGLIEGGDTRLYDAVAQSVADLQKNGDPRHIRAVVVLSDGQDTASDLSLDDLLAQLGGGGEDAGNSIKIFTIGYGKDADEKTLKSVAEPSGGREYQGSPENIRQIYSEIATFF